MPPYGVTRLKFVKIGSKLIMSCDRCHLPVWVSSLEVKETKMINICWNCWTVIVSYFFCCYFLSTLTRKILIAQVYLFSEKQLKYYVKCIACGETCTTIFRSPSNVLPFKQFPTLCFRTPALTKWIFFMNMMGQIPFVEEQCVSGEICHLQVRHKTINFGCPKETCDEKIILVIWWNVWESVDISYTKITNFPWDLNKTFWSL